MNADRNRRGPAREQGSQFKIEDPEERRTFNKFRKHLGINITEEEWLRLQDVKTVDDYKNLQDSLTAKAR